MNLSSSIALHISVPNFIPKEVFANFLLISIRKIAKFAFGFIFLISSNFVLIFLELVAKVN